MNLNNVPDLKLDRFSGGGWFCDVVMKQDYEIDKAMCRCPLPTEGQYEAFDDTFRWNPSSYTLIDSRVLQVGYFANSTDTRWIFLDPITLQGAFTLLADFTILSSVLILSF